MNALKFSDFILFIFVIDDAEYSLIVWPTYQFLYLLANGWASPALVEHQRKWMMNDLMLNIDVTIEMPFRPFT